ncbi:MAG: DsbA family oxidoreductase [Solirubrobacterales bacterium]|nr:DsbA family oxidoreductase [Solirubrobacterales bacterium]
MEVEIWSDIACPWCYVGKRRFEAALAQFEHRDEVTVTWRSFELDPEAPPEQAGEWTERLAGKYGMTREQAEASQRHMTEVAAAEGLEFRFDRARAGNTFDGHRLVHLAAEQGLQDAMKERLLRAYLSEGELIADADTLVRLGVEVGLPELAVRDLLAGDRFADAVRDEELSAQRHGIAAVPTFLVDRRLGGSGAHPPEALLHLLRQAWESRSPAIVTGGDTCGPDGC